MNPFHLWGNALAELFADQALYRRHLEECRPPAIRVVVRARARRTMVCEQVFLTAAPDSGLVALNRWVERLPDLLPDVPFEGTLELEVYAVRPAGLGYGVPRARHASLEVVVGGLAMRQRWLTEAELRKQLSVVERKWHRAMRVGMDSAAGVAENIHASAGVVSALAEHQASATRQNGGRVGEAVDVLTALAKKAVGLSESAAPTNPVPRLGASALRQRCQSAAAWAKSTKDADLIRSVQPLAVALEGAGREDWSSDPLRAAHGRLAEEVGARILAGTAPPPYPRLLELLTGRSPASEDNPAPPGREAPRAVSRARRPPRRRASAAQETRVARELPPNVDLPPLSPILIGLARSVCEPCASCLNDAADRLERSEALSPDVLGELMQRVHSLRSACRGGCFVEREGGRPGLLAAEQIEERLKAVGGEILAPEVGAGFSPGDHEAFPPFEPWDGDSCRVAAVVSPGWRSPSGFRPPLVAPGHPILLPTRGWPGLVEALGEVHATAPAHHRSGVEPWLGAMLGAAHCEASSLAFVAFHTLGFASWTQPVGVAGHRSMRMLAGLAERALTSVGGRLLMPRVGELYDEDRHDAGGGRVLGRAIRRVSRPGCEFDGRVVERARVVLAADSIDEGEE